MDNTTYQEFIEDKIKNNMSLIGQDSSKIRENIELDLSLSNEVIKNYKSKSKDLSYPCKVNIGFTVCYGHVTTKITFGDNTPWEFNSKFWGGGFGIVESRGISFWASDFITPIDGETMCFEIVSATATLGCVHMFFWRKGGPILGGLTIASAGTGIIGGGGTGIWKRK